MPDNEPVRWEYEVVRAAFSPDLESILNEMGDLGWEMVNYASTTEKPRGFWSSIAVFGMVFKRPKRT
jgi:hypothetical protein